MDPQSVTHVMICQTDTQGSHILAFPYRLSSGPYFSYFSYFSLLFWSAPTFPYFLMKMPYYPYFFILKRYLSVKIQKFFLAR